MITKKLIIGLVVLAFGTLAFASGDTFIQPPSTTANGSTYINPPVFTKAFSPGIYIGLQGGYGMTRWTNIEQKVGNDALGAKTDVTGSNAFAGRVYIGYDFHPNFAIEAGYTQFFNNTKINNTITMAIANFVPQSITSTDNPKYDYVFDLVGKAKAHIIGNLGLYGKLGIDYMRIKIDIPGQGGANDTADRRSSFNAVYGLGAFYDITQSLTADLSWTRYNGNSELGSDYIPAHDLFAAGASWKF